MNKRTSRTIKLCFITAFGIFSALVFVPKGEIRSQQIETAGQKFKNIQVLTEMPADQLGKVMNLMSAGLNVNCDFCHVGSEFEKDDNEHKRIAREMISMTFDINRRFFDGKPEVSCNTCHNGQPHPRSLPNLHPAKREPRIVQPANLPSADEIIGRYERAVGSRLQNGIFKAERVEPDGKTVEPMTIEIAAGTVRTDTDYDGYLVSEIFDGNVASKKANGSLINLKPDESEQIEREARLLTSALRSIYKTFGSPKLARIDGRDVYQISAATEKGFTEQLFFEIGTGLLRRRVFTTGTVLGNFVFQADYLDYKKFSGMNIPQRTDYAMPAISWTRRIRSHRPGVTKRM